MIKRNSVSERGKTIGVVNMMSRAVGNCCLKSWGASGGSRGGWEGGAATEVVEVTDALPLSEMVEEISFSWCRGQLEHRQWN